MIYGWKHGTQFRGDPNAIKAELDKLPEITASATVKIAKDPKSSLHGDFTWDDKTAGKKYREEQARKIIRSIVIIPDSLPGDKEEKVELILPRAYEVVSTAKTGRAYMQIERVLVNDVWRDEVFAEIRAGIEELERKLSAYVKMKELSEVAKTKVGKITDRLQSAKQLAQA